jgi:hypothetical protein
MAGKAKRSFERTLVRVDGLLALHPALQGTSGRPKRHVSDVLRGALVLALAEGHIDRGEGKQRRQLIPGRTRVVGIAFALIVASACSAASAETAASPRAGTATPRGQENSAQSSASHPLNGSVLVVSGGIRHSDLYRLKLPTLSSRRLTTGDHVDTVGADHHRIVVADARAQFDRIEEWSDGRLRHIPGLGWPYGYAPDVSRGNVAFVKPINRHGQFSFSAELFDLSGRSASNLMTSTQPLAELEFGPRGRLAVIRGKRSNEEILQILPQTKVLSRAPRAGAFAWGDGSSIAWSSPRGGHLNTTVLNLATSGKVLIRGWEAACWAPNGRQLLMTKGRKKLGVWSISDPQRVRLIGWSRVGRVIDCAWT